MGTLLLPMDAGFGGRGSAGRTGRGTVRSCAAGTGRSTLRMPASWAQASGPTDRLGRPRSIVAWMDRPFAEDGNYVRVLREAGAIPFVRTNVPAFLSPSRNETGNNVYGTTVNPWNTKRSPAGSSGGEG